MRIITVIFTLSFLEGEKAMALATTQQTSAIEVFHPTSYEQAISLRDNVVWARLDGLAVGSALEEWLASLGNRLTEKNYRSGIRRLVERGYLHPGMSLQAVSLINSNAIVDRIKGEATWSEATRQARAACYISFTRYLNRRFDGLIRRASPCKEGDKKTFHKIREKVDTKAMSREQASAFLEALAVVNPRDCLIAKVLLQGAKRVSEGLGVTTECIDWSKCQISFLQSKTKGVIKKTVITYPGSVMAELREHLGDRTGHIFVTSTGKGVIAGQLAKTFERAGVRAGIPFKITPHVLRATAVTLYREMGCSDADLMGVTGHANATMMRAYDQSDLSNNASKKVNLVR
jgi:integrase/recombinase XerD